MALHVTKVGLNRQSKEISEEDLRSLSLEEWRETISIRHRNQPKVEKVKRVISEAQRQARAEIGRKALTDYNRKRTETREAFQKEHNLRPGDWYCLDCRRIFAVTSLSRHNRTQSHLDAVRRGLPSPMPTAGCAASKEEEEVCLLLGTPLEELPEVAA